MLIQTAVSLSAENRLPLALALSETYCRTDRSRTDLRSLLVGEDIVNPLVGLTSGGIPTIYPENDNLPMNYKLQYLAARRCCMIVAPLQRQNAPMDSRTLAECVVDVNAG